MNLAGRIGMPNVHDAGALCAQDADHPSEQ